MNFNKNNFMDFNEKNFTSSFNNDRINKRESGGKSYNPRSVSPFLNAEKAMAGVSKRLAEEKNKAYTVAQSVAKNVWGEKEGKNTTQRSKTNKVTFESPMKKDASFKVEKLPFSTPVPKEQQHFSSIPANTGYAVSKNYGTKKEKDNFAAVPGMDEITAKNDSVRYFRGSSEQIAGENRNLVAMSYNENKGHKNYVVNTVGYSGENMLKKYVPNYRIEMNQQLSSYTKTSANYMLDELEDDSGINQLNYNMWLSKSQGERGLQQDVFQYSVMKYLRAANNLKNSAPQDKAKNNEVLNFIGAVIRETVHNSPYGGDDMHEKIEGALNYTTLENLNKNYDNVIKKWFDIFIKSCDEKYSSANEGSQKKSISPYLIERGINQIIDDFNEGKSYSELYLRYNAPEVSVYNTRDRVFHYQGPSSVGLEPDVTIDRK